MIRKILILFVIIVIVAGVFGGPYWLQWRAFEREPLLAQGTLRLWVEPGQTLGGVAARLEALGTTRADWRWRLLGRLQQPVLRVGEYAIAPGTTPAGLAEQLAAGDVVRHRFTIIEGWTVAELRARLADDTRLASVTAGVAAPALMNRLGCTGCFAEGWFLPETYRFERGDRDLDVLARAHAAMREALDQAWAGRDQDLPLERREELLVLASLVEAETMVADERRRVAGVFKRRLERGMRLQTDPTVVYGLDGFDGRIRRVHLTTDHPWNTYTRHGLPPTPIALPGRASLEASARPAPGEALYFVARGDGTHHFSATLEEHNRAVARYVLGQP